MDDNVAKTLGIKLPSGMVLPKRRAFPPLKDSMSSYERLFVSRILKPRLICGDIKYYRFESVKIRLADNTWYTPDFEVLTNEGIHIFYEVKGRWMDDARVKFKTAAEMYWDSLFVAVTINKTTKQFEYEVVHVERRM